MKLNEINDLYAANLKELHSTEKQLEKALGELAGAASSDDLKAAFEEHQQQTRTQMERIEKILEGSSLKPGRTKAKGIEAIIAEGSRAIQADGEGWIKDLALIDAAQRTEHFEMSLYGCTATYAQLLGKDEDASLLHQTLEEEERTDERLTRIALSCCASAGNEDGSEDEPGTDNPTQSSDEQEQEEDPIDQIRRRAMQLMDGRHDQTRTSQRRTTMTRRNDDDRGYEGREYAGRRSAQMQDRDEYGQFAGYQGGGRGGRDYDDDDRGRSGGGRYSSSRYDERDSDRQGGYEGRSYGGQRSSQMQDRDEYGQFQGYQGGGGGGRGGRDYDDYDGGRSGGRRYSSGGSYGGNGGYRDNDDRGDITDSAGRHYSRESWERAQEGRSRGGQHSQGGYGGGRGGYDYDDDRGYRGGSNRGNSGGGNGGYRDYGDRGDITDSAGRHYSRESWERAQEGRSRGGQHSQGGYR